MAVILKRKPAYVGGKEKGNCDCSVMNTPLFRMHDNLPSVQASDRTGPVPLHHRERKKKKNKLNICKNYI